jgi:hypothetical protein
VVTPEGLPIGYEIFAGNTADVTTVEAMVELMEKKYGQPKRIWVMDRGMVSEDNIEFLRERGARYLVGTPKRQLKAFEAQLLDDQEWAEVQPGVEVKLVAHPDGGVGEQYVLCRSSARREKEIAMLERQRQHLRAQLDKTQATLQRRPAKDAGLIERRIGRCAAKASATAPASCSEVATVRSMDVVLPVREPATETARDLRLRVVARPDRPVAELLHRLGLELPSAPEDRAKCSGENQPLSPFQNAKHSDAERKSLQ